MRLDSQIFLRLAEKTHTLAFLDIEGTGLRGDYNSVLVVSVRPYGLPPKSFYVERPGNDEKVVTAAKKHLEKFDAWVTYYGKGYDLPMLNTRLLRWRRPPISKRHHIDLYFSLKANLLTARKSQGHLLNFLETPEEKMTVSAEVWNRVLANPRRELPKLVRRCESDTAGLQALYERTKHLLKEIKL